MKGVVFINFAELLKQHDLNPNKLANAIGIPAPYIYNLANNKTEFNRMQLGNVIKIAAYLNLTCEQLQKIIYNEGKENPYDDKNCTEK